MGKQKLQANRWKIYGRCSEMPNASIERLQRRIKLQSTGNKKRATGFATLKQNELNSDVARFTTLQPYDWFERRW